MTETGRIPSLIIFIVVTASPPLVFGMNQTAQMISFNPWVISGPSVPIPALVGMGTAAANTKEEDNDS